jgi:transposase
MLKDIWNCKRTFREDIREGVRTETPGITARKDSHPLCFYRACYQRLRAADKAKKVALVACMRKLLTIVDAMLKHRTPWNPTLVHHA